MVVWVTQICCRLTACMPPFAVFNRKASSQKYSRRRRYNPDKDVDSINKGNEHFNKKIDRWETTQPGYTAAAPTANIFASGAWMM